MPVKLRLTGQQHRALHGHLFPDDGAEAVSIGICGRLRGPTDHVLCLRKLIHIPYEECKVRTEHRVTWLTRRLEKALIDAITHDHAVVKFHSHRGGFDGFSETDDASDRDVLGSVHGWTDGTDPHASVIMLPSGRMIGRAVHVDGRFESLTRIAVVGHDLLFFDSDNASSIGEAFDRHARLFGEATTKRLGRLAAGVLGCSGTGAITVEMFARLGFGRLVLVDPDRVGIENLNRILNATHKDATERRLKVDVLADAVHAMGLGTSVVAIPENVAVSAVAVRALAGVDVLFGCVDGAEGRQVLNRISTFYNLPYFDVGVKLIAASGGDIEEVCGAVHYLQPDGSSLLDRRVFTVEQLRAEATKRANPDQYHELLESKYIEGVVETRPAVITVNMQYASMMANEFLARLHPFRLDDNAQFSVVRHSLVQMQTYCERDEVPVGSLAKHLGRGDTRPLLDMPELSVGSVGSGE